MVFSEILVRVIGLVVPIVEACGAIVIVLGVGRTLVLYVLTFFKTAMRRCGHCASAWEKTW